MEFSSAQEVMLYARERGGPLDELALSWEAEKTGKTEQEIVEYLRGALEVMEAAVARGLDAAQPTGGRIIGNDAVRLQERAERETPVCGTTMARAVRYALAVMEVNASMGRIVAAPTAGSCGVLPAVLLTLREQWALSGDQMVRGLLVAGLIGELIAYNATISGARGGCQAEVGSASAMAAGAVVFLRGGTDEQVFDGAAMGLKNLLGLVCDPVAGLVESPCAKRNTVGAANALVCAEMALAGVRSVIPFDEVVQAMSQIGRAMPASLRETSRGGLAATPTACRLDARIHGPRKDE